MGHDMNELIDMTAALIGCVAGLFTAKRIHRRWVEPMTEPALGWLPVPVLAALLVATTAGTLWILYTTLHPLTSGS